MCFPVTIDRGTYWTIPVSFNTSTGSSLSQNQLSTFSILFGGAPDPTGLTFEAETQTGTTINVSQGQQVIFADSDAAAGVVTVNLPAVSSVPVGTCFNVIRLGAFNVTLDGNGSETINGATTWTLTTDYDSIVVISNGSEWIIR